MILQIWISCTLTEAKLPEFAVLGSLSYSYRHQSSALGARWKSTYDLVLFGSGGKGKQKLNCSISSCHFPGINVCENGCKAYKANAYRTHWGLQCACWTPSQASPVCAWCLLQEFGVLLLQPGTMEHV